MPPWNSMPNTGNNVTGCRSADGVWVERSSAWVGHEKKTLGATERNEEARHAWREQMKQVDARRLVIVDEMGSNIGLTPLYARAPKGQRAYGSVPCNYGKNTTLLASLSLSGMGAAMILEGSVDTLAFESYVEQVLAPSLQPGHIKMLSVGFPIAAISLFP